MRIAIFGTGGVGGYFGGRLAQAGTDVVFIARGEHLRAIQERGLFVDSFLGDFHVAGAAATDDPEEVGKVDAVIVAVKTWQVPVAAQEMAPLMGADTVVLPLENGVEAPSQLSAVLGSEHVLGGLCRIISFIAEPGRIRHTGIDPYIALGELNNLPSERVTRLRQVLDEAPGVRAETPEDIHVAMWQKFLLIAAWSGVGAVTRAPIGILRSQPQTRALLQQAMQEVVAVAQAQGINLPAATVLSTLRFVDSLGPTGTSSMQRDIIAGRPSELEAHNGALVRLGEQVGQTPELHRFIYNALLPQELRARGELSFSVG